MRLSVFSPICFSTNKYAHFDIGRFVARVFVFGGICGEDHESEKKSANDEKYKKVGIGTLWRDTVYLRIRIIEIFLRWREPCKFVKDKSLRSKFVMIYYK